MGVIEDNISEITTEYDSQKEEFLATVKSAQIAENELKSLLA